MTSLLPDLRNWILRFTLAFAAVQPALHSLPTTGFQFIREARAEVNCAVQFAELLQTHPKSYAMVTELEKFAKENNLPMQVLEMGPPERRVNRLFVGLDMKNEALVEAYLKRFHLEGKTGNLDGTLALEFQHETEGNYVTGVLRPSPDPKAKIYRWGRPDLDRPDWVSNWLAKAADNHKPVIGYSYLIGLDEKEVANVKYFLENPKQRGPCKSDNCVAWTTGIELGKTAEGATDAERRYLFNELGMARSMAHFEISRRLANAANEKNSAVLVFLNGEAGAKAFNENLRAELPKDPKIPYANIIRGLGLDKDSEVMKAVAAIPDGAKVFFPIAAGASPEAMTALIQHSAAMKKGVDVHVLVNGVSEATLRKGTEVEGDKFRMHALFLGGNMRKLNDEGKINVIPGYLADFPRMMRDPTKPQFQYDAIVVRVSPPDWRGRYSLGPNHDMIMTILETRPGIKVIAEVNPNIPQTTGDNFLKKNQITAMFESKAELAGPPVVPLSDVEKNIGANLGKLVDSNAYLQVGIGNIFGGLPDGLAANGKKGIKIQTEMFGDPLKQLMERGIADNATTGFAYGSKDLYAWLNGNKKVTFESTERVNDPGRVANMNGFHAVNTALQVNLIGDVNATMGPGGRRISSPGGQVEFMSGAARSIRGKAIIAVRSTAKNGELSSITMDLYPGSVTTPHESVTHVVTEYGTAELAGQSERQRAINLIRIAHPKFRAELADQALARKVIRPEDVAEFKK